MPSRVAPGPIESDAGIREAVCVHTKKIFDSCRDKDCLEDLRVYLTAPSQAAVENAVSVRSKSADLLYAAADVESVSFNRGYFTVDIRFYYKIYGEACTLQNPSLPISGLAVFDKRVILFGSESSAKIFSSDNQLSDLCSYDFRSADLPTAVVEAVDPIVLDMRLSDACQPVPSDAESFDIPETISGSFEAPVAFCNSGRRLYVTLGQFTIVRLERDSQLLIPAYDYCVPDKECVGSGGDDPCTLFSRIEFPIDEFFPPDTLSGPDGYRDIIGTAK